jgi:hypothetical protein
VPTKSESIERRRALAEWRAGPQILERSQAALRLQEISGKLSITGEAAEQLSYLERVSLELEEPWIEFTIQIIDSQQKQKRITDILKRVQQENPDVYEWLNREDGTGETPLVQIRKRGTLPSSVAGKYFTKRP